jgi:intracellular sulfur oxidation DsrE/DsrF family protein
MVLDPLPLPGGPMKTLSLATVHAAFAAAAMLALPGCAALEGASATHERAQGANRLVMQVSDADPAKWSLALNNARNVQADLGRDKVQIEIVAYGPGIGMLKAGSPVAARIDEALLSGTKVVACENTMTNMKLTKRDMLEGVGYVPAGVTEIMQRQQQGWAYIRP